jgi:adenylate kinase
VGAVDPDHSGGGSGGASNLVLLGPPGAGKGTLAELLGARLGIPHISSGDMFRAAIAAGTALGRQVAATIKRGELVSDQLTVALIAERLAADDARRGYLLDGFPRTIAQAEALQEISNVSAAIDLDVSDDLAVLRISGRRVCNADGEIYHLGNRPPREAGVCDRCGRALIQRDDDRPAAVRHRLQVYHRQTAPLVAFYAERGLLLAVDGSPPAMQIRDHILTHPRVHGA